VNPSIIRILPWALTAALGIYWLYLVDTYAVDILFADQWNLYSPMFNGEGPLSAFMYQHGPHRQGLGGALSYWLAQTSGFSVIAESYMISLFLIASAVLGIGLKQRLSNQISLSDISIPLIFLNPLQIETVITSPNLSHSILPLFLCLALSHCWITRNARIRCIAAPICATLCLFTGFGVFVYLSFLILFIADWVRMPGLSHDTSQNHRIIAVFILIIPLSLFAYGYRWDPANPDAHFPHYPLTDYLIFLGHLYGRIFYLPSAFRPIIGYIALLIIFSVALYVGLKLIRKQALPIHQIAFLFFSSSLGFSVATALGRVSLGTRGGGSSRYLTFGLLAFAAIYILIITFNSKFSKRLSAAFAAFMIVSVCSNFPYAHDKLLPKTEGKRHWLAAYRQSKDPVTADAEASFSIYPNSDFIASHLRYLEENRLNAFRRKE